ncbi:MAG: hypothetical protein WC775_05775 [Patescibacteria group bacterium]|jgi:hypothetical protein
MVKRKIRVGFDFDGVLFYNPARVIRPFIYFFKRHVLGIKKTKFYVPKNGFSQTIAALLHKSSLMPNKGFDDFLRLVNHPDYEVYIITARLSFLKNDLDKLLKKFDVTNIKKIIQNIGDEQPHTFKERLIKELKLDYYVEDNWDIVKHLTEKTNATVIWIHNLVDLLFIKHPHHGGNLREAIDIIKKKL